MYTGSNDSWLVYLLEKTSGKCLASAEKEEPISDIQCTENSGLFSKLYSSRKTSTA